MKLEPGAAEARALGTAALERLIAFVEERAGAPASAPEGGRELAERIAAADPPEDPVALEAVLDAVDAAARPGFDTAGPGFMAYIPGGGLVSSAVAELLAAGYNRYVPTAAPAPAFNAMEVAVLRWLCEQVGLDGGLGIFTAGGSMANFSALVAARHAKLGEDLRDATLYVSEQAHHSIAKAALLAGLPRSAVRTVPTDDQLRMDPQALREQLASDPRPFLVVATAGTTNTGAIDPLPEVADAAAAAGAWLHVDGAYGGFFALTERGRERLSGIEGADSVALDPHKGLFTPYAAGILLVRDFANLRAAHSVEAEYMQDLHGDHGVPDFSTASPELSRDFRGLRVWLPLQLHGVGAFRAALDEKLDLTERLHGALAADDRLEIVPGPPQLTVVGFRLRGGDDAAQRALQDRINAARRVFLSSTVVAGRFTLRACILSHRTHADRVDELAALIRKDA